MPVLELLSRIVVIGSAAGAAGVAASIGARDWPAMPVVMVVLVALVWFLLRAAPQAGIPVLLLSTYLTPGILLLALGRFGVHEIAVWLTVLLAAMLAANGARRWHLPGPWKLPLVAWALVIAASWPIVVLRETDFTPSLLLAEYHIVNSGLGTPLGTACVWVVDVALTHLVGILWIDWLFGRFRRDDLEDFRQTILVPLAGGWLIAAFIGLYQSLFDIRFLNISPFADLRRAPGSLVDANPFGMLSALWGGAALGLIGVPRGAGDWIIASAVLSLSWSGIWMSGSRSALLAGVIVLGFVVTYAARHLTSRRVRLRALAALGGIVVATFLVVLFAGQAVIGPLERLVTHGPTLSLDGLRTFVVELWNRNGYGLVASRLIAEFPLAGIGVGSFHVLVADYSYGTVYGRIPFDNAQNWFRHQLTEFGLLGSIGWIAWATVFIRLLLRTRGAETKMVPAGVVKGLLIALGLVSLIGMPTQNVAVTLTWWTFVFWYLMLVDGVGASAPPATGVRTRAGWLAVWLAAVVYTIGLGAASRDILRVPYRALRADWSYAYGFYSPEQLSDGSVFRWTEKKAVAVSPAERRWLRLGVRVYHPDAATSPVEVKVWVGRDLVVHTWRRDNSTVTRYARVPPASRNVMISTWVSRTWRPRDYGQQDTRELGVAVSQAFVEAPPGAAAPQR